MKEICPFYTYQYTILGLFGISNKRLASKAFYLMHRSCLSLHLTAQLLHCTVETEAITTAPEFTVQSCTHLPYN